MYKLLLAIQIFTHRCIRRLIGEKKYEKFLGDLSNCLGTNLLVVAYRNLGIMQFGDMEVTGERQLIEDIRKKLFDNDRGVIFDVGANKGQYLDELLTFGGQAEIYAFEPGFSFDKLKNDEKYSDIKLFNLALGGKTEKLKLYDYPEIKGSVHGTLYKEVMSEIHKAENVIEKEVEVVTLDSFCEKHNVQVIDFVKIDTEGFELNVLKGAKKFLDEGKIKAVQFELNEMNIISKVFLKDFYDLMPAYKFFRLSRRGLIALNDYDSINEIFKIQNIFAINVNYIEKFKDLGIS